MISSKEPSSKEADDTINQCLDTLVMLYRIVWNNVDLLMQEDHNNEDSQHMDL